MSSGPQIKASLLLEIPWCPCARLRADAGTRLHSSQLQTYLNLNLNSESIDSLDDVKPWTKQHLSLQAASVPFSAILLQHCHCLMWNIRGSLIWFYFMVTLCLGLAMRIFVWKNYWFKIFRSTIHIICVPLLWREPLSHLTFKSSQQIPSGARKNVSVKNYFHSILTTFLCPEPILLSSRLSAPRLLGNLCLASINSYSCTGHVSIVQLYDAH